MESGATGSVGDHKGFMKNEPTFLTKKDYVVQAIKNAILSGEIRPGDQLRQRQLAERTNTSVTPVREALQELQGEGVVRYVPHHGATVVTLSREDVIAVSLVRAILEELAIEMALPHVSEDDLAELWGICSAMEQAFDERAWLRLRELNYQFHRRIYSIAQNPHLLDVIQYTWFKLPWAIVPAQYEGVEKVVQEHQELLEALEARDPHAKRIIRRHIMEWAKTMHSHLERIEEDGAEEV
jgi:DNA-binding GntR family transcriptional regulator